MTDATTVTNVQAAYLEAYAQEVKEFNMLLKACRYGFGYAEAHDGRNLLAHMEHAHSMLPSILTWDYPEDGASIIPFPYQERRQFLMDIGRHLVEQVRQNDSSLGLAEVGSPYQQLLQLIRTSHRGFGQDGFQLEDLGVTLEERRRWDLAECSGSDFIASFYDDPWDNDDIFEDDNF